MWNLYQFRGKFLRQRTKIVFVFLDPLAPLSTIIVRYSIDSIKPVTSTLSASYFVRFFPKVDVSLNKDKPRRSFRANSWGRRRNALDRVAEKLSINTSISFNAAKDWFINYLLRCFYNSIKSIYSVQSPITLLWP